MFKTIPTIFFLLSFFYCQGQIMIARSVDINPFQEKIEKERRILGSNYFSAEMGKGFFSTAEEQAWNIKFQAHIELYRWGNKASLGLNLSHELHANPYNPIRFNPRGAWWNESLTYYRQLEKLSLQFGINHRCRHDIDNIDPPRGGSAGTDSQQMGRVLVMTSLNGTVISDGWHLSDELLLKVFGRTDVYFYQEDSRHPASNQQLSWTDIPANILGGFLIEYQHHSHWKTYTRNHMNYIFFRENKDQINYRMEGGISFLGDKALGSIFIAHEYFFDDASRPFPQASSVLYVGLRTNSNIFY